MLDGFEAGGGSDGYSSGARAGIGEGGGPADAAGGSADEYGFSGEIGLAGGGNGGIGVGVDGGGEFCAWRRISELLEGIVGVVTGLKGEMETWGVKRWVCFIPSFGGTGG